jgi:coenzyme F420-dependent glucose-6-phosphate dehydrogenase
MRIGIHASQELFSPSQLLERVQKAARLGYMYASTSDHFHPWSFDQGQAGFALSWLGAAMATTNGRYGVVTSPGQRYHPAILAQAAATLDQMFPGRFWLALGSGEALNESITGQSWPAKPVRHQRLVECTTVMRRLWAGEIVNEQGLVIIKQAQLFTRPAAKIPIYGAALTKSTAAWCAEWADGLIIAGTDLANIRENLNAFRQHGGQQKPVAVQVMVCVGEDEYEALEITRKQWRVAALETPELADISTPREFDEKTAHVQPDDLRGSVLIVRDNQALRNWLHELSGLGVDEAYLHFLGAKHDQIIPLAELES